MPTTFLTPSVTVLVNNIHRRTIGGSTSCGFRSFVATATIQFASDETPALPGDKVSITLGYRETGTRLVFTGEVDDDDLTYWPHVPGVKCSGFLSRTQRPTGIASVTAGPDPNTGLIPTYVAEGISDGAIVQALLSLHGIDGADIQSDSVATTFGNIEPVRLEQSDAAWRLIADLDRLTFMRTYDMPDGTVRRTAVSGVPSTVSVTLSEGVSIMAGTRSRTRRTIVNKAIMTGLADAGGPGVTPTAERHADSVYIPNPPRYQSESWQSNLAETEAQCDLYASRRVGQGNRLTESVTVQSARARPDIYPGMSLALDAPHLGYTTAYAFWVEQIDHTWDERSITTSLSLLASANTGGVNPNLAPVPIIKIRIEQETLGDGTTIYVVYADGTDSYDPDGVAVDLDPQHGITAYLWGGNPTGPVTPVGYPRATYVYTGSPSGKTITLRVQDVLGKQATATYTITATDVRKAVLRVLWAAVNADLLVTVDGGKVWQNVSVAAVGVCEIGHPYYQLAWTASGDLYRIVLNVDYSFTATLVLTGQGITAAFINIGVDGTGTHRAWAAGASQKVFLSSDDGLTWAEMGSLTATITGTITAISESGDAFGDLYATCAYAILHSYDAGVTWAIVRGYPDHALVAARMASGRYQALTLIKDYHWFGLAGTSSNTLSRTLEAAAQADVDFPTAAKPANVTGLTLGLDASTMYVTDITADGATGRTWRLDDFTGGGELVAKAWNPAFGKPRHVIRDGAFADILYFAADGALVKSYDRLDTVVSLKTLTGSYVGKMIGYGPLIPVPGIQGSLYFLAYDQSNHDTCHLIVLDANGWHDRGDVGMTGSHLASTHHRLIRIPQGRLFAWHWHRETVGTFGVRFSDDDGVTWADVPGITDALDIVYADDGTLYLYGNRNGGVTPPWYAWVMVSHDNGDTWTNVANYLFHSGGSIVACRLAVDPTNSQTLALMTLSGQAISADGGATFGPTSPGTNVMGGNGDAEFGIIFPSANRVAFSGQAFGGGGAIGGTASPNVTAILGPSYGIWQFVTLANGVVYGIPRSNDPPTKSTDGGLTFALDTAFGVISGIAFDAGTGDYYTTTEFVSGAGSTVDPYVGLIQRKSPTVALAQDLTQNMFNALGTLWHPWAGSVVE